jgi:hypothetical protein
VRIAYDAGKPAAATAADFAVLQADPAPAGTAEWIREHFTGTAVQTKPIAAGGQLMHSKYVIRDAPVPNPGTPDLAAPTGTSAVWTGSTNFTDDELMSQPINAGAFVLNKRSRISRLKFTFPLGVGWLGEVYIIYIKC